MAPYLAAALLAGLTAGVFVSFTLTGALFFYATVAMLVGSQFAHGGRGPASPPSLGLRVPAFRFRPVGAAMFLHFSILLTTADLALERAKRDLDAGRIEAALAAYIRRDAGIRRAQATISISPARWPASLRASNPARALMASQQAFAFAQRAVQTSEERQNAWYNLAGFYATRNDAAGRGACLRRSMAGLAKLVQTSLGFVASAATFRTP